MIDGNLLLIVLIVLTFATALNLFLTLRLAAIVRAGEEPGLPPTVPIGETVPPFEGRRRVDGSRFASGDLAGQATVLVFLSPGCGTCREKTAELLRILPAARRAGVAIWIVPADDVHDIAVLVGDTPLIDRVVEMDRATRRTLNPVNSVPFYLFVDDAMAVKASGQVGDEDWRSFAMQMDELAAGDEEAG